MAVLPNRAGRIKPLRRAGVLQDPLMVFGGIFPHPETAVHATHRTLGGGVSPFGERAVWPACMAVGEPKVAAALVLNKLI
jgi:hypothetical protein